MDMNNVYLVSPKNRRVRYDLFCSFMSENVEKDKNEQERLNMQTDSNTVSQAPVNMQNESNTVSQTPWQTLYGGRCCRIA